MFRLFSHHYSSVFLKKSFFNLKKRVFKQYWVFLKTGQKNPKKQHDQCGISWFVFQIYTLFFILLVVVVVVLFSSGRYKQEVGEGKDHIVFYWDTGLDHVTAPLCRVCLKGSSA